MNIEYESDALPGSRVGEVSHTPMSNFLSPGEGEVRVRDRRQEAIEEIRFRVDIVDVVAEHVSLRRAGKNYVGLCPFHQERTPSFTVSPDKQMFYCFGCQAGGDVFAFLMRREGLSFPEAVESLAVRAGVAWESWAGSAAPSGRSNHTFSLYRLLERVTLHFERLLSNHPGAEGARAFLRARGITAETIRNFRLGWSEPQWDALVRRLKRADVSEKLILDAGLALRRKDGTLYDRFRGRLMFPIRDAQGRVIGFGGRALGDEQPKYLNSPETGLFQKRRILYGLDLARSAMRNLDQALIVEGYMDAVTAHQAGFPFAVASLGTALSEEQVRLLTRQARRIWIAYDADAAGRQATWRGLEHFSRLAPLADIRIVRLAEGEDPDTEIRKHGSERFARKLEEAQPLMEYVFEKARTEFDGGRPEDKARVVEEVAPWLWRLESPVVRSEYIRTFAEALQVGEDALRTELRKWAEKRRPRAFGRKESPTKGKNGHKPALSRHTITGSGGSVFQKSDTAFQGGHAAAERELLRLLVHRPEWLGRAWRLIGVEDFSDPGCREIGEAMLEMALAGGVEALPKSGEDVEQIDDAEREEGWGRRLLDRVTRQEARSLIGRWVVEGPPPGDPGVVLRDCVERMRRARFERRAAELRARIGDRERSGEPIPEDWLREYQTLQEHLRGSIR